MKTKEIQDLIDFISKSGLNEVKIETEQLKLSVKKDCEKVIEQIVPSSAPVAAQPVAVPAQIVSAPKAENSAIVADESNSNYVEIKSPMIGTFYRSANPESDPFASIGDKISVGQNICIIEAMKLFNEIESEISGTIVKILVDDATPVEYDQPLFLVDPS